MTNKRPYPILSKTADEMDSFEKFIVENGNADTVRLVMTRKEWPVPEDPELAGLDAKSLAVNTIEGRKRLRKKLPEWVTSTELVYPSSLCTEQCSSSDTARYKALIVRRFLNEYVGAVASMVGEPCRTTGSATENKMVTEPAEVTIGTRKTGRIADLTGGLGVDSWAFSEVAEEVLYNEMNPALAAAARHNFKALGVTNIFIKNSEATPDSIKGIFGDFRPDVIFLDPARRDSAGKKVFLLEDCSPDVLKMLPELFRISRFVFLKLSPMADITMAVERLDRTYEEYLEKASGKGWNGQWVREVHVVASGGECKELLILLDREWSEGYSLTCREDGKTLTFKPEEITEAKATYPDSTFARIIFEPGKSLTKAGVFNAICERFGLVKLARFTHLYTISEPLSENELEQRIAPLKDFGKVFYVKEILPLNKASMKDVGRRYPHSEVSAKNIPMSSDELRARLKVKSGDDAHIFGTRIETPYSEDNYLIITESRGRSH